VCLRCPRGSARRDAIPSRPAVQFRPFIEKGEVLMSSWQLPPEGGHMESASGIYL